MAVYPTTTATTSTVWTGWITGSTGTTTGVTNANTWVTWCDTGTSTTSNMITCTAGETIWVTWCDGTAQVTRSPSPPRQAYNPPPLTAAQMEAQRAAAAESTARYAEAKRKREEAEARAEKLLVENLDLKQRLEYEQTKSFVVHGRSGKRFRIRNGRSGNVDVIGRDGRISHRLCAHPIDAVPNPDTMLAQKLLLEDDEDRFLRLANRHQAFDNAQVLPALH